MIMKNMALFCDCPFLDKNALAEFERGVADGITGDRVFFE